MTPGRADAVVLVVLDGWGLAPPGPGNAVEQASTPVFDGLWSSCPHTQLTACGVAVGLPPGQMGNSEVGHMNLGAGAVVKQDLLRIDEAAAAGDLASNEVLARALEATERVHLIGLVSDGGVHSSLEHLEALCDLAHAHGVDVVVHAFTDGRDTSPTAGAGFVARIEERARVGSVIGRYFAMDRDKRWDRTQQAYDLLVHGRAGHRSASGEAAVRAAYARGETDEFIAATVVGDEPVTVRPGDSVIAFNFRPDRMRQLTLALCDPQFTEIARGGAATVERYVTLTEYDESWEYAIAFPPARPAVTLPKVVAAAGGRQLHVAETEKYPHVTYFFNGGDEAEQPGERRAMAPSPRDVPTYDHKPEMSAARAAALFTGAWREAAAGGAPFAFGIINFANPDMVGHTGVIPAAVKAVEAADRGLAEVVAAVRETGGALLVTADHGNADEMLEDDGSPDTAHSLNPVPFVVVADGVGPDTPLRVGGVLADVAPTVLHLLGVEQPAEMTGRSLLDA
jgi:2,3-bisphosphoglycerate-independent phosphoglycerate mutase